MLAAALVGMLLAFRNTRSFIAFLFVMGVFRFETDVGDTVGGSSNLSSLWMLWLIVLCLFALLREKVFRHKPTAPEMFYGLFLLWCAIEAGLSDNVAFAARMHLKLLYPFLVMLLARLVVDNGSIASSLLTKLLLTVGVVCMLIGGPAIRLAPSVLLTLAPVFWPGAAFADCAAIMTPVALSCWRLFGKRRYLALALLLGTSSLLGFIRTGVAATAIGVSVFAILEFGKRSLPLVLIIYLGSVSAFFALPEMREKMFVDSSGMRLGDAINPTSIDYKNIQSSGRFAVWQEAMDRFFWDNPAVGSGLGTTQAWFYRGGYPGLLVEHSEYVRLLCDTGIIGLTLFLVMIASCMVALWRVYRFAGHPLARYFALMGLSMFPAYLFCMGFDNVLNYALPAGQYPFAFTGAAIGLCRALRNKRIESTAYPPPTVTNPLRENEFAAKAPKSPNP